MKFFTVGIAIVLLSTMHLSTADEDKKKDDHIAKYIQGVALEILEDLLDNSFSSRLLTHLHGTMDYLLSYHECEYDYYYCAADQAVAAFEGAYVIVSTLAGGSPKFGGMNEVGYGLYKEVDRQKHRKTALWAREVAKKGLLYRLSYDNSNEFHPYEPERKPGPWMSQDPNFVVPTVRIGKFKPFFFESYPKMQKKYKIFGPPDYKSKRFKKALMEVYKKGEYEYVKYNEKALDIVNLWRNDTAGVRTINLLAQSIFDYQYPLGMKQYVRALHMMNMAMHDATHFAFFVKHKYGNPRPRYFINKGVPGVFEADKYWKPYLEADGSPEYIDSFGAFLSGLKVLKHVLGTDEVCSYYYSDNLDKKYYFDNLDEIRESVMWSNVHAGTNLRYSQRDLQKEYEKMGSDIYYYFKYDHHEKDE